MTLFSKVYDMFFTLITDDMYMELTEEETRKDCRSLLMAALPDYEFPQQVLTFTEAQDAEGHDISYFHADLTHEEIHIIANLMLIPWLKRQMLSIEQLRQITSGADFKVSSQAAHLRQLQRLMLDVRENNWRIQALQSRRRVSRRGRVESTFDLLVRPV